MSVPPGSSRAFPPSISTSSPAFVVDQALASPLSTSMSSHHQSSERSGYRGEDEETDELDQDQEQHEDAVKETLAYEGGGEEGEGGGPPEEEADHQNWDDQQAAVLQQHEQEGQEHQVAHAAQEEHDREQQEQDEGSGGEGGPDDDLAPPQDGAAAYHNSNPSSRHDSGAPSPSSYPQSAYLPPANGTYSSYPSAPQPAGGSSFTYPTSSHPLQTSHFPTTTPYSPSASVGTPHNAIGNGSSSSYAAYGSGVSSPQNAQYGAGSASNYNSYLQPQQPSQYGYRASPPSSLPGHLQMALPLLNAVTSASRTNASSEHSYDHLEDDDGNGRKRKLEYHHELHGGDDVYGSGGGYDDGDDESSKKQRLEQSHQHELMGNLVSAGLDGLLQQHQQLQQQHHSEHDQHQQQQMLEGEGIGSIQNGGGRGNNGGRGQGEKKHICPECSRGFARAYNLKTHIQTHSPDPPKPHVCPHDSCGHKAFSRSHDLMRHKGSVHGEGVGTAKQSNGPRKKRTPKKLKDGEQEGSQEHSLMGGSDAGGNYDQHSQGGGGLFGGVGGVGGDDHGHGHMGGGYGLEGLVGVGEGDLGGGPEGPFGDFGVASNQNTLDNTYDDPHGNP